MAMTPIGGRFRPSGWMHRPCMVNRWDRFSPFTGMSGSKLNGMLTAREYKAGNLGKR